MILERDLRATPQYAEVRDYFIGLNAVGSGKVVDAADITLSPDGGLVAFTGTVHADIALAPHTRVCLARVANGQVWQIESVRGSDRLPRWSPDGQRLAFLSDREQSGNFQLYLTDAGGRGAVKPIARVEGTIEYIEWSPDGRRLLAGVAGFGADMAGCQGGATTVRKESDGALPAWIPSVDTGDADNLWRSVWIFDIAGGTAAQIRTAGLNHWEATWVGNDRIVAVTSESHSEGSWYQAQMTHLDLAGSVVRTLYTPADQIGVPTASPSGRTVAVIEAVCSDRLIVAGGVLLIDPVSGSVRRQDTHGVDVSYIGWRDEWHLVYAGVRGFETVAGEIDVGSGEAREHWKSLERTLGNWYPGFWPAPRGGLVAVAEAFEVAPEIVLIRDGEYKVLVSLDEREERSRSLPPAKVRPVSWRARDGLEIQGWLVSPDRPGPLPLVMDVHGGPIWCCRNRWQGRLRGAKLFVEHGCAVFYPNPRGSSGRGPDFARLVKGDMGGEDTYDYLTGVDELVKTGVADPARLGVTGISYGGFISAWLITQDPRFAAAVPISCVSNFYSQHRTSQIPYFDELFLNASASEPGGKFFERSPVMHAARVRTPTLQLTGALDQNTPPTQALEFHRSLLENGVRSVLVTYPTAGHGIRSFPEVIDATTRYVSWLVDHFQRAPAQRHS
jgi:dipeptidyl aminopeptidase/acylaminoacyl peptidase